MSLPEVLLWQELRKQSEVKFRRQHPLGPYVLDFYCAAAKLCIEIDGIAHDMGNSAERDASRDEWLREKGVTVLRIAATEVLRSPHEVAEAVMRSCLR
ncbi:endonuclease domain-containing protein [Alteriqipengyuania abyssalis]